MNLLRVQISVQGQAKSTIFDDKSASMSIIDLTNVIYNFDC